MAKKVSEEVKEEVKETAQASYSLDNLSGNLKKLNLLDLQAYESAVVEIYEYYDNMARACEGSYTEYTTADYASHKANRDKYLHIKNKIFAEIKSRVDGLTE